ncbi:unnamed protein product [Psylliodes chrysocephalus]|uniref:Uncharacterized protein n=1 Tax=Psylliodes chrysocephalus TaxID=3402493 RepID=A0A9P0CGI5_9CUCU|nr:unnamed protein product [Psylliodes chrysocephala]
MFIFRVREKIVSHSSNEHYSQDINCPALGQKCLKCNKIGHYRRCLSNLKRKPIYQSSYSNFNKKFKRTKQYQEETDYVFHIDDDDDDEEMVPCTIGRVDIEMRIDSGSRSNLITGKTWYFLKERKITVSNKIKNPD